MAKVNIEAAQNVEISKKFPCEKSLQESNLDLKFRKLPLQVGTYYKSNGYKSFQNMGKTMGQQCKTIERLNLAKICRDARFQLSL